MLSQLYLVGILLRGPIIRVSGVSYMIELHVRVLFNCLRSLGINP